MKDIKFKKVLEDVIFIIKIVIKSLIALRPLVFIRLKLNFL